LRDAKRANLYVDGDSVEIGDALVTICPWWDGPETRADVLSLLERDSAKAKKKWIWIYHAPPANSPVCWNGRKAAGDECLSEWIARFSPDVVLCGHIHNAPFYKDGSWIDQLGKTWVFNPGKQIGPVPTYLILDFQLSQVQWSSLEDEHTREIAIKP
jgi:Icc-related predicted phosphoesterase